jgi:hypothetical protein
VRDTFRVMRELADAPELVAELKAVEAAFNRWGAGRGAERGTGGAGGQGPASSEGVGGGGVSAALSPSRLPAPGTPHTPNNHPKQHRLRYASASPRRAEGEYAELLPWLLDQASDFEAAAAAGAPTTPPLPPSPGAPGGTAPRYRLFSLERGGAASCGRALLRAAESQSVNKAMREAAGCAAGGAGRGAWAQACRWLVFGWVGM